MTAKHTPAPWRWNGNRLECVGGAVIEYSAYEGMWLARHVAAEDEANKTLMAAAPEMLAALEAAVFFMTHHVAGDEPGCLGDMYAAIAKAKGETT